MVGTVEKVYYNVYYKPVKFTTFSIGTLLRINNPKPGTLNFTGLCGTMPFLYGKRDFLTFIV